MELRSSADTRAGFTRMKTILILLLLLSLFGCYAGTVKPFIDRPEFKAENEPVRTLRILVLRDGVYRRKRGTLVLKQLKIFL
jgi:hypothetical protein